MNAIVRRTLTAAVLVALLATVTACSPAPDTTQSATPTITPVPTTSVEPTDTPEVSTGDITTPGSGTALRAAILKAASAGLGMSGTLTVYQIYAQGTAAVGDVKSASGSRMFFALIGGPDAWELAWSAPFGSSLADSESLLSAAPQVSPELTDSIDWTKKAPAPKPKPKPVPAPTLSSFKTFAMKSAVSMAGSSYEGTFTVTARIAKDSKGVWWGNALAEPSDDGLEALGIWGRYANGKWTGEIADFSSQDADAAFFPADVLSKLRF